MGIVSSTGAVRQCTAACLLGVLSHAVYFIRGRQHSRQSVHIVCSYILGSMVASSLCIQSLGFSTGTQRAIQLLASYFAALFGSIITYRVFFHRTRHFPGPSLARVTKFYAGPWLNRHGKMHEEHRRLAGEYGDFVRIAPNEIMIRHIDALAKVHGGASRCTKGMVYDNLQLFGVKNLDGIADRPAHRLRRQVWDKAFGTRNLEVYERHAEATARDWLQRLGDLAAAGRAVDTSLFSLLISFDNMGRVGFSREFGLVTAGRESHYLELLEWLFGSIAVLGSSFSWPVPIVQALNLDPRQRELEEAAMQEANLRLRVTIPAYVEHEEIANLRGCIANRRSRGRDEISHPGLQIGEPEVLRRHQDSLLRLVCNIHRSDRYYSFCPGQHLLLSCQGPFLAIKS